MFCPDCNTNLDDVPVDDRCPTCAGLRRSAVVTPEPARVTGTAGAPSIGIGRDDHRPWDEKWREVLRSRDLIRDAYTDARGLGNAEVDARVNRFCSECHDLRDWLNNDIANLPGVTTTAVKHHHDTERPLRISSAVANSHKHHTRYPGQTTARIRHTLVTPDQGARVTIEVDWATPHATTVDALDLANESVDRWRAFFKQNGIAAP
jgi:hypothetical protein